MSMCAWLGLGYGMVLQWDGGAWCFSLRLPEVMWRARTIHIHRYFETKCNVELCDWGFRPGGFVGLLVTVSLSPFFCWIVVSCE